MSRKTNEQIRAELDELNAVMAKKQHISDTKLIVALNNVKKISNTESFRKKQKEKSIEKRNDLEFVEKHKNAMVNLSKTQEWKKAHKSGIEKRNTNENWKNNVGGWNKGLTHSDETKKKISEKLIQAPKYTCSHCSKIGQKPIMARWHGDNCKHKK